MQLFTTAEAAAYLRLKERKIYEMVAEGTVLLAAAPFPSVMSTRLHATHVARYNPARPTPAPNSHTFLFLRGAYMNVVR